MAAPRDAKQNAQRLLSVLRGGSEGIRTVAEHDRKSL